MSAMTAMKLQAPDSDRWPGPPVQAGEAAHAAGADDYFTLVACVCKRALRDGYGYLDLIEAINRIDAAGKH